MNEIELPRRQGPSLWAVVDDQDLAMLALHKWYAAKDGHTFYAIAHIYVAGLRTSLRMHCYLLGATGIDHVNGNGLDNRRENLRIATGSQNGANRFRFSQSGSSRFKGVTWAERSGNRTSRWQASIGVGGRQFWLGYHDTEEAAALAYNAAAGEAFGEFARLNEVAA